MSNAFSYINSSEVCLAARLHINALKLSKKDPIGPPSKVAKNNYVFVKYGHTIKYYDHFSPVPTLAGNLQQKWLEASKIQVYLIRLAVKQKLSLNMWIELHYKSTLQVATLGSTEFQTYSVIHTTTNARPLLSTAPVDTSVA